MSDIIIGLIPDYGLLIVFIVVLLSGLAVPLPSSVLVLASGAFAATGDLVLWSVLWVTFIAFVLSDQIAYSIATRVGPRILAWMRSKPKLRPTLEKSEALLEKRGEMAVFLSHTIFSPTGPYVSYICGMAGMRWVSFSVMATLGAAIWSGGYVMLGYLFATQLSQVSEILSQFFGVAFALALVLWCLSWLRRRWRRFAVEHMS
jgi:membrane protein DedA with SNARE-associated domain